MGRIEPLAPETLYRCCDLGALAFQTTDDLEGLDEIPNQDRAMAAVRFGMGIRRQGYNIFALGPLGTGKHTAVHTYLERQAAREAAPPDWCYVHDFDEPHRPRALKLPTGRAAGFREAMKKLVGELRAALPAAFESEDYRARRQVLEEQFKQRHEAAFESLQARSQERHIALVRTPMGLALAPVREGRVVTPDEFHRLPEGEQASVRETIEELGKELEALIRKVPQWEREQREALRKLQREVTAFAVGHLIDETRAALTDLPAVAAYLDAVERDVLENADDFLGSAPDGEGEAVAGPGGARAASEAPFRRYRVNVLVDNAATEGAPVVYEDHPTLQTLVGRAEHLARFGTLLTDFNLLKPGALHRANGGYLVLDALKVLTGTLAWDSLKRALRARELRIESLDQVLSLASTVSLEPEPIPLDVKVVLVGERRLYYLLSELDPEFPELFKVAADFDDEMPRTAETTGRYARFLAGAARREGTRPLDRGAVARVIEHAARLADDSERLSTHARGVVDLLCEADHFAAGAGRAVVAADDVQAAIDARARRADRMQTRVREAISRGTLLVDTEGARVGQVNGLAVLALAGHAFGRPARITARVALGKGEVVDIEREAELGGPLHSKGVLILGGFLAGRYGAERPLSLRASLVFEQSYGAVDGDSASSAELYALLSALADAPLRQDLAVTGSVNQHGEVQAIGGVNEKVEGFFDVCAARGLTGTQGVLIPAANVPHLMLRADVVAAVREGRFAVYPVRTIDAGLELLTGVPAGARGDDGRYPEGTLNRRVDDRFAALTARVTALAAAALGKPL